jgi:hypothetical protein
MSPFTVSAALTVGIKGIADTAVIIAVNVEINRLYDISINFLSDN